MERKASMLGRVSSACVNERVVKNLLLKFSAVTYFHMKVSDVIISIL